jgi:hypothetical protein
MAPTHQAETRLRFDPVTCIITVMSAAPNPHSRLETDAPVSIYDLASRGVALRHPATEHTPGERFAEVHGAVVVVGVGGAGPHTVATVLESGGEIVRGEGRAHFSSRTGTGMRLHVEAMGDDGRPLLLDGICTAFDERVALTGA